MFPLVIIVSRKSINTTDAHTSGGWGLAIIGLTHMRTIPLHDFRTRNAFTRLQNMHFLYTTSEQAMPLHDFRTCNAFTRLQNMQCLYTTSEHAIRNVLLPGKELSMTAAHIQIHIVHDKYNKVTQNRQTARLV